MLKIISQLIELQQNPEPFAPGELLFWNDPHISKQMLDAHLDPNIEAASRKPETIDRSVKWLIKTLGLKKTLPFWTWDVVPVYIPPASPELVSRSPAWIIRTVPSNTLQNMRMTII
ncbi:hypothetical protein [Candidatus Villigracilis saccharophilus]|uniref:hypothetical protein n=1 Tax=Candidatus Villigracilis saccharophilus TaxID=3140684 RepID=UPI0031EDF011